jgi:aminoglycoside 3-N-acetyltransferase
MPPITEFPPVVTKSRLCVDLQALGVSAGQTLMLHASVKAVGRVVGGPDMVIAALLDVLGPEGTLMMMVSYEDSTFELNDWPEDWRQAYLTEAPPYDPKRSRAYRKWSILTEYLRTWPGAERSNHPDVSFAAIGPKARWLTADHPLNDWFGVGSPLDKLCQADGVVLLLGCGFELTLLHHAESIAKLPKTKVVRYKAHMLLDGEPRWVDVENTVPESHEWQGNDYFQLIPLEYLSTGRGHEGLVGAAKTYLFEAAPMRDFAVNWLERHLG